MPARHASSLLCPAHCRGHKTMLRYVSLSVCMSHFLILSRSLDGGMCASPLKMHLIEGSTVGYASVQMLSAGHIVSLSDTLFTLLLMLMLRTPRLAYVLPVRLDCLRYNQTVDGESVSEKLKNSNRSYSARSVGTMFSRIRFLATIRVD